MSQRIRKTDDKILNCTVEIKDFIEDHQEFI